MSAPVFICPPSRREPGHHLQVEGAQSANQALAETIWLAFCSAASSDDHRIALWNSAIYRSLERALVAAIAVAWDLSVPRARKVRDALFHNGEDVAYNVALLMAGEL